MWFRLAIDGLTRGPPPRGSQSCTNITDCLDVEQNEDLDASYSHFSLNVPVVRGHFEERNVLVWHLPASISQSRLAGRQYSSNACTIISLKVVEYLHENNILFPSLNLDCHDHKNSFRLRRRSRSEFITSEFPCPGRITNCLANAILEGNEIHERAIACRLTARKNFTIPEALNALQNSLCELDFCSVRGPFHENLAAYITAAINSEALSSQDRLYFLLIVVEQCVTIIFQRSDSLISFFDSHLHAPNGGLIACTTLPNLDRFCSWLANRVFVDINILEPSLQSFELASIYWRDRGESVGNAGGISAVHSTAANQKSGHQISTTTNGGFGLRRLRRTSTSSFNNNSICRSSTLMPRRHSVFPPPLPEQLVTRETRQLAQQIVRERRRQRYHQNRQKENGMRRGAQMSTSMPLLL